MVVSSEKVTANRLRYLSQRITMLRAEVKDLAAQAAELRLKRTDESLSRDERIKVGRANSYIKQRLEEARGDIRLKEVERSGLRALAKPGRSGT